MIVYRLACAGDHHFEGWFASAEACEQQALAGQIACPACGSQAIRKLPTAPHVRMSRDSQPAQPPMDEARLRAIAMGQALERVRTHILKNTQDVGQRFPEVARRIHYGEEDARNIRGRASRAEARELDDEGIEAFVIPDAILPGEETH